MQDNTQRYDASGPKVPVRTYIAGPMTGLPEFNYPAFNEAARQLRALGFEVENPADNPPPPCGTWKGYMRLAVRQLALCDRVVLLPQWQDSRGACAEFSLAKDLGLQILTLAEALSAPQVPAAA